jgi:hypothetical protein
MMQNGINLDDFGCVRVMNLGFMVLGQRSGTCCTDEAAWIRIKIWRGIYSADIGAACRSSPYSCPNQFSQFAQ